MEASSTSSSGEPITEPLLPDGGEGVVTDTTQLKPRSTVRLHNAINPYGLAWAKDGSLYAAGATIEGSTRKLAVWRFGGDGGLDATFGTGGVLSASIAGVDNVAAFDIAEVTPDNFIVLANGDGKVWLTKLTKTGDAFAFGTPTAVKFGWTDGDTGWPAGSTPSYMSWGIGVDRSDANAPKIVVFAHGAPAKVASGTQRTDNDRWVTRGLFETLAPDPGFNGGAALGVDGDDKKLGDNARRGIVTADGTIYSSGYTSIGGANNVILLKLEPDGTLDPAFNFGTTDGTTPKARPGQVRFQPFTGGFAEAYAVHAQSTGRLVTTGYGTSNFDAPTKNLDLVTFGGRPTASTRPTGGKARSRSRARSTRAPGSVSTRSRIADATCSSSPTIAASTAASMTASARSTS